MKSKLTFCSLLAVSIVFLSCKKEAEAETETAVTTTSEQPVIVPNVAPIPTETYVQPQPNQQVNTVQTPQTVTQAPVVTKPGMNPPHGQAGHRCDIAVGAPLNSPVAKAATPAATPGKAAFTTTTTSTPAPTSTTTTTAPTGAPAILQTDAPAATPAGMNPPHGQPGHVCGTPVGSPLPK